MRAAAHNKSFAKKIGIPQSVARDYTDADKKTRVSGMGGGKKKSRTVRTGIFGTIT